MSFWNRGVYAGSFAKRLLVRFVLRTNLLICLYSLNVQAHDIYKQLHNMNLSDLSAEIVGKV